MQSHARHRSGLAIMAATLFSVTTLLAGCSSSGTDPIASIPHATTAVGSAPVVGWDRPPIDICPAVTAPDSSTPRTVKTALGEVRVPAEAQRIVVLGTQALDTACALGVWERIVAATTDAPGQSLPHYLGVGIAKIPLVGTSDQPDIAGLRNLKPDLIVGSGLPAGDVPDQLKSVAPTVFVGEGSWQLRFISAAAAFNRERTAQQALDQYRTDAADRGRAVNAWQTRASVVHFTADSASISGSDTFAAQVLADIGVPRTPAQGGGSTALDGDYRNADGDIVYATFDSELGAEHAEAVFDSDEWRALGAAQDHRVFATRGDVWNGSGLTAARQLVYDVLDSINTQG